ncbi:MAG: hypothetical protein KDD53_07820 [Bdellovibrionales bacterium]|nr:hypothetical protein [Bdellovibrionales bacterium]
MSEASVAKKAEKLGLGKLSHHIFICCDQSNAKCCKISEGLESWNYLKRRIVELGLDTGKKVVFRTKANCLRICQEGPVAVVYPEGIWYSGCTPEVIERILQEHILNDSVVEEFVLGKSF